MSRPILREALSVTTLLLTSACGGAPFQALEPRDIADAAIPLPELEASVDANKSESDSSVSLDAGELDAQPARDAGLDVIDAADSAPACTSKAAVVIQCGVGAPLISEPGTICVYVSNQHGASDNAISTPSACANWCTFTCACLLDAGLCAPGTPQMTCSLNADGTIRINCEGTVP